MKWSNDSHVEGFFQHTHMLYELIMKDWIWRPMESLVEMMNPMFMYYTVRYDFLGTQKDLLEVRIGSLIS